MSKEPRFEYCLDHYAGGIAELAEAWRAQRDDQDVTKAIGFLEEKFESVNSYGPMQVVEFHNDHDPETRDEQARRAHELVQRFLHDIKAKGHP